MPRLNLFFISLVIFIGLVNCSESKDGKTVKLEDSTERKVDLGRDGSDKSDLERLFGKELSEELRKNEIRNLDQLIEAFTHEKPNEQLKSYLQSVDKVKAADTLMSLAYQKIFTDPKLNWLADALIEDAFVEMKIPDVYKVYKYVLNLDPAIPHNKVIIDRCKLILKKRTGVDYFGLYIDSYQKNKYKPSQP